MFRRFLLGSVASNLRRVVAELVGKFASNFEEETYKVDNQASTFTDSITHSATTNATMTSGYGPELITNGTFDSASDWTLGAGWSITGGAAYYSSGGGGGDIRQNVPMVNGKTYLISLDVVSLSGSAIASIRLNAVVLESNITQSGTYEYVYTKTASEAGDVIVKPNNLTECTIDNISVREMPAIKWRPHNLLTYSEDLTTWLLIANTSAGDTVPTLTPNYAQAPDGTNTAARLQCAIGTGYSLLRQSIPGSVGPIPQIRTWAVWLKSNTGSNQTITIRYVDTTDGVVTVTPTWQLFEITTDGTTNSHECDVGLRASATDSTCDVLVWHPHSYRADLGGMVNNPDQEAGYETYVPTTSSPVYLPRRGHHIYNGYEWVNEGMLHESEARTNLVTYSEDFSQWTKNTTTITTNTAISPDGNQLADTLEVSSTHPFPNAFITYSSYSSNDYTFSVYAKYLSTQWFALGSVGNINNVAFFDILNGVVGTAAAGHTAFIEQCGNGWFRCSVTFSGGTAGSFPSIYVPDSDGLLTGTAGNSVYIWGAQLEEGSTPSSYIPTSGATSTRAAETLTIPAANLPWPTPNVIGANEYSQANAIGDDTDATTGWFSSGAVFTSQSANTNNSNFAFEVESNTAPTANARIYLDMATLGLTAGKVYKVSVDVKHVGVGNLWTVALGQSTSSPSGPQLIGVSSSNTSWVRGSAVFIAGTLHASYLMAREISGSNDGGIYLDNLTIEEIDPLSVSIQMNGRMTYADDDAGIVIQFAYWSTGADTVYSALSNGGSRTGQIRFFSTDANGTPISSDSSLTTYSPGVFVPFNIASRHGTTFVNGAIDGVALTTTASTFDALPDLSTADLVLGNDFMGTIENFQIFDRDVGDDGLVTLTKPSEVPSLFITFDGSNDSYTVLDWSE